jgi:hypothetical protein
MNEPRIMKYALLALLAFAAPAPFAEAIAGAEDDVAVQCVRASKSVRAVLPPNHGPRPRAAESSPRRASWSLDIDRPRRSGIGWSPSHFTRPPPQL